MLETSHQVSANFIGLYKNELSDGWYQKEYILKTEDQLRSIFTAFGDNIKDQLHYMFQQAKEADLLEISYRELLDFSIAIRHYFTMSFKAILSGYMNFFVTTIRDAFS
ncbi:hypothetical protein [Carnobacterium divergens]|uniref:hypothetical protein n=1 Tax=Carnobacterium divergens TaxID=2748 RepID=UPI0039B0F208